MRVYIVEAYKKASSVIESCENLQQIEGARNYLDNFYRVYENAHSFSILNKQILEKTDSLQFHENIKKVSKKKKAKPGRKN